jgi:signal transduction histidine kinase
VRLADFIRQNLEPILQEWEDFAVTLHSLAESTQKKLRDHAEQMLLVMCADLETYQGEADSIEKSKGNAPDAEADTAAEIHAEDRMLSGVSTEELMAEYRALRSSVLRLWQCRITLDDEAALRDMIRFNEAIDQAVAESVARHSEMMRESQNVFLAILGHDVRNPLGAVNMGAQLLMGDPALPARSVAIAQRILGSAQRIEGLVADLIDFSVGSLGRGMPVKAEPMDFAAECVQIVEEIRALHPDRQVELTISGDLHVVWDRARVNQALSNLIGNAIQHGDKEQPVWIVVESGDQIVISVRNKGPRIEAARLHLMFDPGRRFSIRSASERSAGNAANLGLGLYITREIVTAHGGEIRVSSTEDAGTIFALTMPRIAETGAPPTTP